MRNKKGGVESWMVYTGIILIVLVVFGVFIKDWGLNMKKEQRVQMCKRSVEFSNIDDKLGEIGEQLENPSSAINTAIKIGVIVVVGIVLITVTAGGAAVVAGGVASGVAGGTAAAGATAAIGSTSLFAGATAGAAAAGATGLTATLTAAGATGATFATQAVVAGAIGYGVSEIAIPTAEELLFGNPEDVDLKCSTESNKINSNKKDQIYKEIADNMYTCYDMFGKGEYDNIFGPNGRDYCFICSIVSFKKDDQVLNRAEFSYYLITHTPRNGELSYSDLFAGCDYRGCSQEDIDIEEPEQYHSDFDFITDQDYAIIYNAHDFDMGNSASVIFMPYEFEQVRYFCDYVYISEE